MSTDPRAGQPATAADLVDVARLVTAYYTGHPDVAEPAQQVAFGTSGHRGSSLDPPSTRTTSRPPARRSASTAPGPVSPARCSSAATPTRSPSPRGRRRSRSSRPTTSPCWSTTATATRRHPAVSHAILRHNRDPHWPRARRRRRRHPVAQPTPRRRLQVQPARRRPGRQRHHRLDPGPRQRDPARRADATYAGCRWRGRARPTTTSTYDFLAAYVDDLPSALDLDAIRAAGVRIGADPLGGASVDYWARDRRAAQARPHRRQPAGRPDVAVHDPGLGRQDPDGLLVAERDGVAGRTMSQVTIWSGAVRSRPATTPTRTGTASSRRTPDCSTPTTSSRWPSTTCSRHRDGWAADAAVGKTLVSSSMIDRVAESRSAGGWSRCRSASSGSCPACSTGRSAFGGEESAGASFLRRDGSVWTTDKDGMLLVPARLGDPRRHRLVARASATGR